MRAVIIDDQHRRHVLLLLEVRSVIGSVVRVQLITRKNGAPMPYVDCLWLEYELNHVAGLVRVMTPLAHVNTSLSFLNTLIRTLETDRPFEGHALTKWLAKELKNPEYQARVNAFVKRFAEMKVFPRSKTVMYQYANIVAGVLSFNTIYDFIVSQFHREDEHGGKKRRSVPLNLGQSDFRASPSIPCESRLRFVLRHH